MSSRRLFRERRAATAVVAPQGTRVGKTPDKQIKEIEQTQEALRESIEEAKQLADKAQELLQKHKETIRKSKD